MFKTALFAAAASTALLATPSIATPAGTPDGARIEANTAPIAAAPAKRETRYCVVDTITGSIIPRKVCHTRKDWIDLTGRDPLEKN
ncbi:hypothetical protein PX554_16980 [Sphingomonas sp. H39-1-10]|uniref:hypothetical protein n=1 Tax=Sphingomonas pollutisoli TaxID=3030829 RepID=UPI0023B91B19|nr:hypothetical protein [Sphingomonas pollutisoli]MDF0489832.1 hypothetical protein [Sphingomonas pollutisoli]